MQEEGCVPSRKGQPERKPRIFRGFSGIAVSERLNCAKNGDSFAYERRNLCKVHIKLAHFPTRILQFSPCELWLYAVSYIQYEFSVNGNFII